MNLFPEKAVLDQTRLCQLTRLKQAGKIINICSFWGVKPSFCRAMAGGKSVGENYAFAGMHHIFDENLGTAGMLDLSSYRYKYLYRLDVLYLSF